MTEVEADLMKLIEQKVIPQSDLKISAETTELMTNTIIKNINAVVGENDILVHLGDFLFAHKSVYFDRLRYYRKQIVCKNMHMIWGNHDNLLKDLYYNEGFYSGSNWQTASDEVRRMFLNVYNQKMFNINGQKVITSHYPMRSWDNASHGSYMLYGHVHNLYIQEELGNLLPYEKKVYEKGFADVMTNHGMSLNNPLIADLLKVVASTKAVDLSLDVGVDHIRGDVPFGTPWSMEEIHEYMNRKKTKKQTAYGDMKYE